MSNNVHTLRTSALETCVCGWGAKRFTIIRTTYNDNNNTNASSNPDRNTAPTTSNSTNINTHTNSKSKKY